MAQYPEFNDNEVDLIRKIVENTASLATLEAGDVARIVAGTGISISPAGGTGVVTITNAGVSGGGTANQVAFWNGASTLTGDSDMTFATDTLTVTKATIGGISHIANAITSANSLTSVALSALTLGTGTSGAALTIASATNRAIFSSSIGVGGVSGGTGLIQILTGTNDPTKGIEFHAGAASPLYWYSAHSSNIGILSSNTGAEISVNTTGANGYAIFKCIINNTNKWDFGHSAGAGGGTTSWDIYNRVTGANALSIASATSIVTFAASITLTGNITLAGTSLITKVGGAIPLITTSTAITSGAGASLGTLTNAPSVGNPTSWVPINDNGTTRYIPAW